MTDSNNTGHNPTPHVTTTTSKIIVEGSGWQDVAGKLLSLPTFRALSIIVVVTVCAILYQQQDRIFERFDRYIQTSIEDSRARTHNTALSDFVIRQRQTNAVLATLNRELGSSRSLFMEYHNGTENLRGIPFLFQSATAEVVAPGVSREMENFRRIPLNTTVEMLTAFLRSECVVLNISSAPAAIQTIMRANGTHTIVACPVFAGEQREPTGYILVTYGNNVTINQAEVIVKIKAAGVALGAIQSAYLESMGRN